MDNRKRVIHTAINLVIMLEMSDAKQNLMFTDRSVPLIKVWLNNRLQSVRFQYNKNMIDLLPVSVNAFY